MDFRSMLDERLQCIDRFKDVQCGDDLVEERDGVVFHGVWLKHCIGPDGGTVQAGLVLKNGCVGGFFYRVCQNEFLTVLRREALLNEVGSVLDELVESMAKDRSVGGEDWFHSLALARTQQPVIVDETCLRNEKTGGKVWKLDNVLIDFGFCRQFGSLVLGWRSGVYAIAVADSIRYWDDGKLCKRYDLLYEADFTNAEDGNALWKKVVASRFLSKKCNVVYRLMKEDLFSYFHGVKGVVLNLD